MISVAVDTWYKFTLLRTIAYCYYCICKARRQYFYSSILSWMQRSTCAKTLLGINKCSSPKILNLECMLHR